MRSRTRRLPLRLTDLESRVTPALSLHGPYTAGELEQLSMTGANAWQVRLALAPATAGAKTYFDLDDFVPARLNVAQVRHHLAAAPRLFESDTSTVELSLPKPDGTFARFRMWEYSIMEPGYVDPSPTFWAYRGQGIDDPYATVHADVSPLGFHAQVLSPDGAWYVDPYWHMQTTEYVSYFRTDLHDNHSAGATCASGEPTFTTGSLNPIGGTTLPPTGSGTVTPFSLGSAGTTRTYRLACAATGEYTAFFGGTATAAETAIKAAVNRMNQVYFNELSILFGLVTNNNNLIYTIASTDPYTDGVTGKMVDENQSNVDTVIGGANYDIGHVFGAAGTGGFAPGRVGVSLQKARGCTTRGTPQGDAFWIDFVAHEIGHQFNAAHTFNGSHPQRTADHAFEPGSGSTIMGYAGIMGSDNVQANGDPFFHVASLDDIVTYVKSIPTVGTSTPNGNSGPTFGTGPTQVIPAGTPFFLAAQGVADPNDNGASLTFSWEQKDLGPTQALGSPDNGSSPLFRSYSPTSSGVRYFPRLEDLTTFVSAPAEVLPTTNRTMRFELTVRDNHFNGGGYNSGGVDVQVVNTGQFFAVTSQKFGASWSAGSTRTVNWNVAGTTGNGINTNTVRLSFSADGGLTYPFDLGTTANDGSHDITVPNFSTTTGRVKVQATNQNFFAINGDLSAKSANITIAAGNLKGAAFAAKGAPVLRPNRPIQFDYSVVNQDGNSVGATDLSFYISINPNPVQTGSLMGTVGVPPLAGNQTFVSSAVLNLPSHMATWIWNSDGTYYVGMLVDGKNAINEVNELDNFNQGDGIDTQAITVTNVADDAYEENDDRQNASTVLQNSPGVWLSSKSGKGVQHDTDYYRFTVPPQSTKLAHIQVEMNYDNSAGNTSVVLEIPPVQFPGPASFGTNGQVLLDYYGDPGDYGVSANAYDLRWAVGPDLRGPQVTAVFATDGGDAIAQHERLITPVPGLKVEFNEPLTKTTAEAPANWQLIRGGTDISGQITKITYTEQVVQFQPTRYFVTLDLAAPQSNNVFELRALPGITDADGQALDGNGDNTNGDPFIRDFRIFDPNSPGPEAPIAQIQAGNQRRPQVALNGSYVAVWEGYGQEGDSAAESNIYARLYNDAGQPLAPEFRVNTYTTGEQSRPAVASDGKGNFIVTWQSLGQDGDGYGVYYRQFKSDGTSGGEIRANGFGTTGNQQNPAVAMNAAGQFVIAYETNRQAANGYDIVITGNVGIPGGPNDFLYTPLNEFTTGDQTQPALALNAVGDYVVTWQSAGQDGSGLGVYHRRVDVNANGFAYAYPEARTNGATAGNQGDPSVALNSADDFVFTWTSSGQDGAGDGVYAQRYKGLNSIFTSFAPDGPEFRVNASTAGDQNSSSVAIDADGDTVITWQSQAQDGAGLGIFGRRYSVTGVAQGGEFPINSYTTADQGVPAIAVDTDGDYFVVWQSAGQDGSDDGVYGRTYSVPQPEVTGKFSGVTAPGTTPYTFSVTITDNLGVDVSTLGTGDIRITGPNGFNALVTFVGVDTNTNGTPRVATYKFDPPGGTWSPFDNGLYSVLVEPNQIGDLSGNFAAGGIVGAIHAAVGGDYLVSTTADSGLGSLRQAVLNANAAAGAQVITFDPDIFSSAKTITLTTGAIVISDATTVQGPGPALVTVSGGNAGRVLQVQAPNSTPVTIEGLTVTGGNAVNGGAILADVPIMTLRNCVFTGNQSTTRGGVIDLTPGNGAVLTIEDSTLLGNSAGDRGGVVSMLGFGSTLTIRRSTLSGNTSGSFGGVAYIRDQFKLTVEDSTLSGNKAKTAGGAIYTFGNASKFLISNSTLSGNAATGGMFPGSGGALALVAFSGAATIQNSTIAGNTASKSDGSGSSGGGLFAFLGGTGTSVTLSSTIVAGNSGATPDLHFNAGFGTDLVGGDNNLIGVADVGSFKMTGTGNQTGTKAAPLDAKLAALANNGGPTQTHALLPGSAAIDTGSNAAGLTNDQRGAGFPRVIGKAADIGAFESPLHPLTLIVNTIADVVDAADGKTSLREAIIAAEALNLAVVDTITFDPAVFNPSTITLNGTELPFITDAVTINGLGAGKVTISGASKSRIFNTDMPAGEVFTLNGVTLINGNTIGNGGAIYVGPNDDAIVINCVITGNTGVSGGGIALATDADLVMTDCTLSGNTAIDEGGGLYFFTNGSAAITGSTISGNTAKSDGGGVYFWGSNSAAALTIRNSTVSGNTAALWGGGIALFGYYGTLVVENSTITKNSAPVGGALSSGTKSAASVTFQSSILFGNAAATGPELYTFGPPVTVLSSLLATTTGASSLKADGFTLANIGIDPLLGPLVANGGPTLTHAIAFNSPAVNTGTNPFALTTDQRGAGFSRNVNGVDVGAFEVQSFPPPQVMSLFINGGVAQRSIVTSVKVTFDQPVILPANPADAFQLKRLSDNASVTLAAAVSGNSVTLTFTGGAVNGTSLADGRYALTAFASKITAPGGLLDGNMDGVGGDNFVYSATPPLGIFRHFGDNDGDGDVDAADFGQFRQAFGSVSNLAFDFDGDGDVDASDFGQFRQRFGGSV